MNSYQNDLVVLVSNKNMEATIGGLISRPQALGIRAIRAQVYVHPQRDPGCLNWGSDFLRPMIRQYIHALVMFDREGCGQEGKTREALEQMVMTQLATSGWENRAATVVLDPELEVWVWSDSPEVDRCLGWQSHRPALRTWLQSEELWPQEVVKPPDPKEAMQRVLRQVRKPRSSAIYGQLAQQVSFRRCTDRSFEKFGDVLRNWFPPEESP